MSGYAAAAQAGASLLDFGVNVANSALSVHERRKDRRRANKLHQIEVEDLKKAGLNPILSAGGPGAPATSGSHIPAQSEFGKAAGETLSRSIQRRQVESQIGVNSAQAAKIQSERGLAEVQKSNVTAQMLKTLAETPSSGQHVKHLYEQIRKLQAETKYTGTREKVIRPAAKAGETIDDIYNVLDDIGEAGSIKNKRREDEVLRQIEADVKLMKASAKKRKLQKAIEKKKRIMKKKKAWEKYQGKNKRKGERNTY